MTQLSLPMNEDAEVNNEVAQLRQELDMTKEELRVRLQEVQELASALQFANVKLQSIAMTLNSPRGGK